MKAKTRDDFLMSPTVDYCFKELLAYPEIRKGFVAAILNQDPEKIAETTLMPTILGKDTENGKYGILDVRIKMKSGTQMDLEMQVAPFEFWNKFHEDRTCFREIAFCDLTTKQKYTDLLEIYVLELKKLPPEQKEEPLIIKWMRFLAAESREDFEKMAGEDNYINEAYEVLQKLSADKRKRLEYEARQKAIRDYDSQMSSSREEGIRIGEDRLNHLYEKLMRDHRSDDLVKAISDKVYREKLYQEYGL